MFQLLHDMFRGGENESGYRGRRIMDADSVYGQGWQETFFFTFEKPDHEGVFPP